MKGEKKMCHGSKENGHLNQLNRYDSSVSSTLRAHASKSRTTITHLALGYASISCAAKVPAASVIASLSPNISSQSTGPMPGLYVDRPWKEASAAQSRNAHSRGCHHM